MEDVKSKVEPEVKLEEMAGAFVSSLIRNNKKIREDRAIAIAEAAQMIYKREVEGYSASKSRKYVGNVKQFLTYLLLQLIVWYWQVTSMLRILLEGIRIWALESVI